MTLRHPTQALAWQFWAVNRRGWLLTLGALPICAAAAHLLGATHKDSEVLHTLCMMAMVFSLILIMALCDFTDRDPRGGFAGFPRRLFILPARTAVLVGCPMLCALLAVVGAYLAWTALVIRPTGVNIPFIWPAIILGTSIVLFQTIIWCLAGFRVARIVVMSLTAGAMVTAACSPLVLIGTGWTPESIQMGTGTCLIAISVCGYALAVAVVGTQRRGGARGWGWGRAAEPLWDAATFFNRRPQRAFASPERALFSMEWRRHGLILPAAMVFCLLLILGPISWINGHDATVTSWTVLWLFLLPMLLAGLIGKGIAKPDFWSLELAMSPFAAVRPVTHGQIISAKLKSAACSTLLAWAILPLVVPIWISVTGNLHNLNDIARFLLQIYTHRSLNAINILLILTAMLLTWSFMVNTIWLGQCGRADIFYSLVGASLVLFLTIAITVGCSADDADARSWFLVKVVPWMSWVLASLFTLKMWAAVWALGRTYRRNLATGRAIVVYICFWIAATGMLIVLAWLLSSQVIWLRNLLMLGALLVFPIARIGAAPLALARNRHR